MGRDAAIDFDHCGRFRFVDHGTQFPDFLQRVGHERLSAETRLDAHDEHQVDQGYDVAQHFDRRGGLDRNARFGASAVDQVDAPFGIERGFVVEGDDSGACLGGAGDVFFGFDDHQMYVQQFGRGLADGFHHRESERDIRDEYAVHDVDMHPFGGASVDHLRIAFQVAEIGRQHRGGYDSLHGFRFLKLNNRNKDNFGVEFTQNTLLFLAKIVNSK